MPANINSTFLIHKQVVNPLIWRKRLISHGSSLILRNKGKINQTGEREKMKKTEQEQDNKLSPFNKP